MLKAPEKLWMYMDYKTGRMLAIGSKKEMEDIANRDFEFIVNMQRAAQKTSTMFDNISG